jgi:hypothetical protein
MVILNEFHIGIVRHFSHYAQGLISFVPIIGTA